MTAKEFNQVKLLFICSRNQWRSPTAERLFDRFSNYAARSAGTETGARIKVTAGHVGWADMIFVMEKKHKRRLEAQFADILSDKKLVCLNIPDDYAFMEPALIDCLKATLSLHIEVPKDTE